VPHVIDTDYNGESFFVRHAYFTGADEPYERLKRALRADIDEAARQDALQHVEPPVRVTRQREDRR
jgi:adenine-specific DNA-methyltransferase